MKTFSFNQGNHRKTTIWGRVGGTWSTLFRVLFSRYSIGCAMLFLVAELWFEWHGIPGEMLGVSRLSEHAGVHVDCRWVKLGIFNGITLYDVNLGLDTPAGPCLVRADAVSSRFVVTDFFKKSGWLPAKAVVEGGKVNILNDKAYSILAFQLKQADLEMLGDNQLRVAMEGECQGLAVAVNGDFRNAREYLENLKGGGGIVKRDERLVHLLTKVNDTLRSFGRISDDSYVRLSVDADCLDWKGFQVHSRFNLDDLLINGEVVSKLRGRIEGGWEDLHLDGLNILLSRSEMINVSAHLYLASNEVEAETSGLVAPSTVCHLLGMNLDDLLQRRVRIPSVFFQGQLPRCKCDAVSLAPTMKCVLNSSFDAWGTGIASGELTVAYQDGEVSLNDISIELAGKRQERLTGHFAINVNERTVHGEMSAFVAWMEHLKEYGVRIPEVLLNSNGRMAAMKLTLQPSPFDWREMSLSGVLVDNGLSILSQRCPRLSVLFRLNAGGVSIDSLVADLEKVERAIAISAQCDLVTLVDKKDLEIDYDVAVRAQTPYDSRIGEGLTCQRGKVNYSLENKRLSASCEGKVHPDWIYATYFRSWNMKENFIYELIDTEGVPVEYTASFPEISLEEKGGGWSVQAAFKINGGRFNTFNVKNGRCDLVVNDHEVQVNNIKGETKDGAKTSMDIRVRYAPLELVITNLTLDGNPAQASAFILNDQAQYIYKKIWQDIHWDPRQPPHVFIPELRYVDSGWTLTMNGQLNAKNARYHDYVEEDLELTLNLNLPSSVSIAPVIMKTAEGVVRSEIGISFGGIPKCEFKIDGSEGFLNPKDLLIAVEPSFEKVLEDICFADKSQLSMKGEMFLSGDPRISMEGTLASPSCKWRDWEIHDVDTTWAYVSDGIRWNIKKGDFWGGQLHCRGVYDIRDNRGEILAFIDDMPFDTLNGKLGLSKRVEGQEKLEGKVGLECHARFLKDWAGRPWNVEGAGKLAIREADLWSDPFLAGLGSLVTFGWLSGGNKLGKISELDADVEFHGNRLLLPQLYTNGTIIALTATGEYGLDDEKLKFVVSGVPLKDVNLLSIMLRPLSWAFQAELTGTRKNYKWSVKSGLTKLLFSND